MRAVGLSRFSSADKRVHGDSLENLLAVPELRGRETPTKVAKSGAILDIDEGFRMHRARRGGDRALSG
jgi:hypothetical protein